MSVTMMFLSASTCLTLLLGLCNLLVIGLLTLVPFFVGPSTDAAAMRKAHVFKIIPMLNPTGVILGNSRQRVKPTRISKMINLYSDIKDHHANVHAQYATAAHSPCNYRCSAAGLDFHVQWKVL